MSLTSLYQETILDHNKHPRNFMQDANANHHACGANPLCGDKLSLYVTIHDEIITRICFTGSGCAISMASASLMTEALQGKHVSQSIALQQQMHDVLTKDDSNAEYDDLGKLIALAGVKQFPARVKCATLCWHTLIAAIENTPTVSTE